MERYRPEENAPRSAGRSSFPVGPRREWPAWGWSPRASTNAAPWTSNR